MIRRLPLSMVAFTLFFVATSAAAQTARAMGSVRETDGKPLKGATVRAINPDSYPSQITSVTDDKGRFAMVGLRSGTWRFVVEAPGFVTVEASAPMRVAGVPPLVFTLARDLGPIPDALDKNIQQQLVTANTLRDSGRLDQAIAAYREIRTKNPKLTALNFVMAGTYRKKAALETDPAARRGLFTLAVESYTEVLKTDADNERAKSELESTRIEASSTPQ